MTNFIHAVLVFIVALMFMVIAMVAGESTLVPDNQNTSLGLNDLPSMASAVGPTDTPNNSLFPQTTNPNVVLPPQPPVLSPEYEAMLLSKVAETLSTGEPHLPSLNRSPSVGMNNPQMALNTPGGIDHVEPSLPPLHGSLLPPPQNHLLPPVEAMTAQASQFLKELQISPFATEGELKDQAPSLLERFLEKKGILFFHSAGFFDRLARDASKVGFKYVGDEKDWVRWDLAEGKYIDAAPAEVTGFLSNWISSKPFREEYEMVKREFPLRGYQSIMETIKSTYDKINFFIQDNLPWRSAAIKHICGHPALLTKSNDFDIDPAILNCRNGFLDLRTMEFTSHEQNHGQLFRMCVACNYNPEAKCPRWLEYLGQSHPDDMERPSEEQLIPYLQFIAGTSAMGEMPPLRAGFWVHGPSTTGKSVFSNTLYYVLGSYATSLDPELVMRTNKGGRMENTLASLSGKRLMCVNEVPDGMLNDARFKALTSPDPVAVREMYDKGAVVKFTHTFLATTNNRPVIRDTGGAVFNRLRPVPFKQVVENPNPDLEQILQKEASGILNWIITGAQSVIQNPRRYHRPPAIVQRGVDNYREEMDVIANFVEECCTTAAEYHVTSTDSLFDVFKYWGSRNNQMALSSRQRFKSMMEEAGYVFNRYRSGGTRIRGVAGLAINQTYTALLRRHKDLEIETATDDDAFDQDGGLKRT